MIRKKQYFFIYFKKICVSYSIFLFVSTCLLLLINFFVNDVEFHSLTGCYLLDPAPFPGIVCEKSLTGNVTKSIFNFPINFFVTSMFGFFTIKGVGLLIFYWAPIIFLLIMRRKKM